MTGLERRHAVMIVKTEEQLRDERDALCAELDGCDDLHCTHHWAQHEELDRVCWLLGEAKP